jgi:hypothetical protein
MICRLVAALLLVLLTVTAGPAAAHKPSDAYLRLTLAEDGAQGSLDMAVRDLDLVIGLDGNGDGALTWGELKARHEAMAAYVQSRLTLTGGNGKSCPIRPTGHLVDRHTDGAYAVLRFTAPCPGAAYPLTLRYGLFFDLDPTHRGLLAVDDAAGTSGMTAVLSPEQPDVLINPAAAPLESSGFRHFLILGLEHILLGYDHLLFLLVLLLPAVFRRDTSTGDTWRPIGTGRQAAVDLVKILTAFTLAHGLSLTAAMTGLVELPTRLVESAIAVTIILTAIDNIRPCLPASRWRVAFGFGLIHGLGFASALGPLDLSALDLMVVLAGFNLGIEAGQIGVALLFLAAAFPARTVSLYPRALLPAGSVAALLLASLWLVDRALAVSIVPF